MKPRNFRDAIDELENHAQTVGSDLKSKIHELEEQLKDLKPKIEEEARKAKDKVETQVRENPWAAIGIVGLIFFVLGCLFGRRRD